MIFAIFRPMALRQFLRTAEIVAVDTALVAGAAYAASSLLRKK